MEVGIEGELQDIVIRIEHQAARTDVAERMYEYACYAWLLRKRPVWSMVVYTDDAISGVSQWRIVFGMRLTAKMANNFTGLT